MSDFPQSTHQRLYNKVQKKHYPIRLKISEGLKDLENKLKTAYEKNDRHIDIITFYENEDDLGELKIAKKFLIKERFDTRIVNDLGEEIENDITKIRTLRIFTL